MGVFLTFLKEWLPNTGAFEMLKFYLPKILSSIFRSLLKRFYLKNWDSEEDSEQLFQQYHSCR